MAERLACDEPGRAAWTVAAIATVSADYLGADRCARTAPVAAVALHGTADQTVPMGGVTHGTSVHPPVVPWAAGWARRNGCGGVPARSAVRGADVLAWPSCPAGADVVLYEVAGGRHEWFRDPVDATALSWAFFRERGPR
jgi:polyhydroxybutyrate depolymerase